jgi:AcrR family transcriptional regulator
VARTPKVVEDRREQILDAALRAFAQKGFARTTNKDIAREAGITPGLIYHYFASKEALFRAIIDGRSPLQLVRTPPPQLLEQPPELALRFFIRQLLAIAEGEPFVQLIRLFLPEVIHNPAIAPAGLAGIDELARFVERYLADKMARGELRQGDAALTTQVLLSNLMGAVLRRQVIRDPAMLRYSQEQVADSIASVMLHGLLPGT